MLMITDDGAGPVESREGTLLLRPPADAVTVRVRDGRLLRTGGPFAETKEHVAGVELVECADLDEAIAIASTHPAAGRHPIEIRPFWPFEED
ncbi:YciI family protein [Actinophytocola sp.]|uniref:YciI family protein n=1 Tax=Actinophytocola sp. TaxID=1872138 RepID=UPI002ED38B32